MISDESCEWTSALQWAAKNEARSQNHDDMMFASGFGTVVRDENRSMNAGIMALAYSSIFSSLPKGISNGRYTLLCNC